MITCPSCGAQNDDANRFCDQCGTRLEAPAGAPAADFASQPTAAAATCPSCGAVVLPGEAFCDSCGASLQNVAVASAPADAPTVFAPAVPSDASPSEGSGSTVTCPMCGHQNLPGDRFCDNCGAALQGDGAGSAPAPETAPAVPAVGSDSVTVVDQSQAPPTDQYVPPMHETAAPTPDAAPPTGAPQPATQPEASPPTASEAAIPPVSEAAPEAAPAPSATPAAEAAPEAAPVAAPADDSERTRLEEAIAKQRQVVAQLEQTQAALGSLTPPAIQQALDDARSALAQAEGDLAALPPPRPAVDPAEVARLEDASAKQRQVVAQLEQTQAALGSLTPPAIQQALDDARSTLTGVEGELAALTGGAAAPAQAAPPIPDEAAAQPTAAATAAQTTAEQPAVPTEAQSAPLPPTPPAPVEQAAPEAAPPTPVSQPPVAPPPPAPAGPRFVVVEGGAELPLPTDRSEIVVGREDPISQIFPEIDLTPYGGESGGVSRQHARLSHSNGQWVIVDLNSTNYTRVNGARLDPNKPTPLTDGAQIHFGRVAVTFHA